MHLIFSVCLHVSFYTSRGQTCFVKATAWLPNPKLLQHAFNISPATFWNRGKSQNDAGYLLMCLKRDTNLKPLFTSTWQLCGVKPLPPPPHVKRYMHKLHIYYIFKTFKATINTLIHIHGLSMNTGTDNTGRSPSFWSCELIRGNFCQVSK